MYRLRAMLAATATVSACFIAAPGLAADQIAARFSWALPKTVIDTTISYTFDKCENGKPTFKITPTLAGKPVPDPLVGRRKIDTKSLESFFEDRSISVQTFSGSHILSSIGSTPTNQTAQIGGNILGGIAKLVGIVLGVPPVAAGYSASKPAIEPTCKLKDDPDKPDTAADIVKQIKDKKDKILELQKQLSDGVDEGTQKKNTAAIQAAQTVISALQDKVTITIKTTIDPGLSPPDVDSENDFPVPVIPKKPGAVDDGGLVATICPSANQLSKDVAWFNNLDTIFKDERLHCAAIPSLTVHIYLDFTLAKGTMFDQDADVTTSVGTTGPYNQTSVPPDYQYRDVAYIPVLVWRGDRPMTVGNPATGKGPPNGPTQLAEPQRLPFGQFGVAQKLPIDAGVFKKMTWQVSFQENGEITSVTFNSTASGVVATSFFGSAVSAANSIASEQRNAASLSAQAGSPQSQADAIYQNERFKQCQINPSTCPSK
jgi:hypothetical protein